MGEDRTVKSVQEDLYRVVEFSRSERGKERNLDEARKH